MHASSRNGVPDLLRRRRSNASEADHLNDVHTGVGAPRDDREPARVGREGRGLRVHLRGRLRQAHLLPQSFFFEGESKKCSQTPLGHQT